MVNNVKIIENCYTIRYAAGQYWLLDISQAGIPYKKPLILNEVGAQIWNMLVNGHSLDVIVCNLAKEYDVAQAVIEEDITQYINQLKAYGVRIEE